MASFMLAAAWVRENRGLIEPGSADGLLTIVVAQSQPLGSVRGCGVRPLLRSWAWKDSSEGLAQPARRSFRLLLH